MNFNQMTTAEKQNELATLRGVYGAMKNEGLQLDMSRGKPSTQMLSLANPMLDTVNSGSGFNCESGLDVRNYGSLDGIPEAKRLMAGILGVAPEQVMVYGNSSLNLMYDTMMRDLVFGTDDMPPLFSCEKRKWICPVPGYDRHFKVTEALGFEMINVDMTADGPDMDAVERLVRDETVKGIWCVPKYSNPGGVVYSGEVIRRLARLKPAAADFRIYCDNAYAVHDLYNRLEQPNLLTESIGAGNPDICYLFTSTSKISFAGGGITAFAAGPRNLARHRSQLGVQTISHDKLNQLRHARYFRDIDGVYAHMEKYMALLRPKFETVLKILDERLSGTGIGSWNSPRGGYFISFDAPDGCAKRIVRLCKEAGLTLTGAGAAFPYGVDPNDRNIRIAPSCPDEAQLKKAGELFCVCVKIAALEKIL